MAAIRVFHNQKRLSISFEHAACSMGLALLWLQLYRSRFASSCTVAAALCGPRRALCVLWYILVIMITLLDEGAATAYNQRCCKVNAGSWAQLARSSV